MKKHVLFILMIASFTATRCMEDNPDAGIFLQQILSVEKLSGKNSLGLIPNNFSLTAAVLYKLGKLHPTFVLCPPYVQANETGSIVVTNYALNDTEPSQGRFFSNLQEPSSSLNEEIESQDLAKKCQLGALFMHLKEKKIGILEPTILAILLQKMSEIAKNWLTHSERLEIRSIMQDPSNAHYFAHVQKSELSASTVKEKVLYFRRNQSNSIEYAGKSKLHSQCLIKSEIINDPHSAHFLWFKPSYPLSGFIFLTENARKGAWEENDNKNHRKN